jgi:hypothetical protein
MATYQYPTEIDFSGGITGLFQYLNTVTAGWFSNLLLIAIYIIFASGFYYAKRDFFGGCAVGGFAILVFGVMFWAGGFISWITYAFIVAVAIVSFIGLWFGPHNDD